MSHSKKNNMEKFLINVFQWISSIPHVKMLHILCGMLLFLFVSSPLQAITGMKLFSLLAGYFCVLIVGHLKEWFDCKGNWSTYDFPDLFATLAGGFIASLSILMLWSRF